MVAIKRFFNVFDNPKNCRRILREIELLYELHNQYIVKPLDAFMRQGSNLYLVLELGKFDLSNLGNSTFLVDKQVRIIMYRLLIALNYIHSGGIVHRDIKPGNILVNLDCSIKLCDFNLGRQIDNLSSKHINCANKFCNKTGEIEENIEDEMDEGNITIPKIVHCSFEVNFDRVPHKDSIKQTSSEVINSLSFTKKIQRTIILKASKPSSKVHKQDLTNHIVTRWYRPPEVILLEKVYTTAIDIWGVGCVFAELLGMIKENQPTITKRSALFPGNSCYPLSPSQRDKAGATPQDQLRIILNVFGSPNDSDLSFLNNKLTENYVKEMSSINSNTSLRSKFPVADDITLDLLQKLLTFSPYYRISAKEPLTHPYFNKVRDKTQEIEIDKPIQLITESNKDSSLSIVNEKILNKV